ncbi:MAG: tyrosine-type recombinase/integrase [Flavobacteriales bacterium]
MYLEEFFSYIKSEKRFSDHTIISYTTDLNQFTKFLKEEYDITDQSKASFKIIRNWVSILVESGLKSNSVNRKISTLKTFYKFLSIYNYSNSNPTLKLLSPKSSKRLPVFVEKENMNHLFDSNFFDNSFCGRRDKLIIELFYFTGMRLSELMNIKISDLDFVNSQIKVLGKSNKERLIPITYNVLNTLSDFKNMFNPKNFLFSDENGEKLYSKKIYRIVNKYLAKISSMQKKSPHVLRHSFATHMLNNGADINAIKEILGHANLSATQIYTHNSIKKLKNVHKQAHPKA